jgi:ubiquinone biosynthesis protein Coq4
MEQYIHLYKKVGKEMLVKQQMHPDKPVHLEHIKAHKAIAKMVTEAHDVYHICKELEGDIAEETPISSSIVVG